MSSIQKFSGKLVLGPARHDRAAATYKYVRVGNAYLERVRVAGELATVLQAGKQCTLWVVEIDTPTPFLFSTKIHTVYAVEVDGVVHKAIDVAKQGWATSKWLGVMVLLGIGTLTLLLYIGFLFWICAVRLSFVDLPSEEEMEGAMA